MYDVVYTRLDIAHAMELLSKYMSKPWEEHWTNVKRVFRHLCGTLYYRIYYQRSLESHNEIDIQGFVDVYWVS